jgi:hypothetical protein
MECRRGVIRASAIVPIDRAESVIQVAHETEAIAWGYKGRMAGACDRGRPGSKCPDHGASSHQAVNMVKERLYDVLENDGQYNC